MGRYWRTLRRFWGTALATQLEYQLNVLVELLAVVLSLGGSLLLLSLFFGPGRELGGWSWNQALIVQGFYTVFDGMTSAWLRPNLGAIVTYVREGTLDFVLLKPIDSQFWVSLRTFAPAGLSEVVLGLGLAAWGAHESGVVLTPLVFLLVLVMLMVAALILYSLWFLIAATSIWFVKTWNATEVLRALLASGRYPLEAYPSPCDCCSPWCFPLPSSPQCLPKCCWVGHHFLCWRREWPCQQDSLPLPAASGCMRCGITHPPPAN